jgi:DNA polymerase-3 subunit delta'
MESGTLSRWDELCKRMENLPNLTVPEFFKSVSQWAQSTDNLEQDLQCIRFWLRDVILTLLAADYQPIFEYNPGILHSFPGISPDELFEVHDTLESASRDLTLNANRQLTLEGVCLAIRNMSHGKGNRNPLP